MCNRFSSVGCLALLGLLAGTSEARAHRLNADVHVLADNKVQIESWFDTGGPARAGRVQVFRADGSLLTEGRMNDDGVFVFAFTEVAALRVVVNAGAGHRKELLIPAERLTQVDLPREKASASATPSGEESPAPVPRSDRSSPDTFKDVLIGVGFLLALAAFVISVRNALKLRELQGTQGHFHPQTTPKSS
jgi:nickel transport protein